LAKCLLLSELEFLELKNWQNFRHIR